MQGSSGIPKSDINSMAAPTTTGDANAELKNSTESYKRLKTHKPPSIREKERANKNAAEAKNSEISADTSIFDVQSSKEGISPLSNQDLNQHTAPAVSSSRKNSQVKSETHTKANDLKEIAVSLALRIRPALIAKDLHRLEIVVKGMEENNLRFDHPTLVNSLEIKEFIRTGIIEVIVIMEGAISDQAEDLLIRMIRLGCNTNAMDELENSVLILACKAGRSKLVKVLLTECPDLIKDWLNIDGQNAAMVAYKHGHVKLYPLLKKAGIPRLPENPAIQLYISSIVNEKDGLSASEKDKYLDLFEDNNYMNLPDKHGWTLLVHALLNDDVDFISFLYEQNRFINAAVCDTSGKSASYYINLVDDPAKRENLLKLINNESKQTG